MAFKFSGIDASGKQSALTITGMRVRILPDRILIDDEHLMRNQDCWSHVDGVSPRFTEVVIEVEDAPPPSPPEPTPLQQAEKARADATAEKTAARARAPAKNE